MKFKNYPFFLFLAGTDICYYGVSAAETELFSETRQLSAEESTVSGADEKPNIPSQSSMPTAKPSSRAKPERIATVDWETRTRLWHWHCSRAFPPPTMVW